ncbi:MAG: recombinase family protein [Terracidiphilus sp.]
MTTQGVALESCSETLSFSDNDGPSSKLMFSVVGACAGFERSTIKERQLKGIALARKAGVYKGRKSMMSAGQGHS